jgi:hypothetical protein
MVTLIATTKDCTFGGYTPVAWSSRNSFASDLTLKGFVFKIKNPHNRPPQIFKQKKHECAIHNEDALEPPRFGYGDDIYVYNWIDSTSTSPLRLRTTCQYANETGESVSGDCHWKGD